jgi:hypothetical protein
MVTAALAGGFLAVGLVLLVAAVRGVPVVEDSGSVPRRAARRLSV